MKVYVVEFTEFDDEHEVLGVFSSRDAAGEFVRKNYPEFEEDEEQFGWYYRNRCWSQLEEWQSINIQDFELR